MTRYRMFFCAVAARDVNVLRRKVLRLPQWLRGLRIERHITSHRRQTTCPTMFLVYCHVQNLVYTMFLVCVWCICASRRPIDVTTRFYHMRKGAISMCSMCESCTCFCSGVSLFSTPPKMANFKEGLFLGFSQRAVSVVGRYGTWLSSSSPAATTTTTTCLLLPLL